MARSPRIEFHKAWYHLMNRGAGRRTIFPNDELKEIFLELLSEIHAEFGIEIHAYCLMSNHFHLLVRTQNANLNLGMQKLASAYARSHNRALKIDGPLFKGRYKAILIAEASYLAQVSRYIHLNPVEAKLVKHPRDYDWSSYQVYCHPNTKPPWLYLEDSIRGVSPGGEAREYLSFVENPLLPSLNEFYRSKRIPGVLGNKEARRLVENKTGYARYWKPPEGPALERIIGAMAQTFDVEYESILQYRKGKLNQARAAAIYMAHCVWKYSAKQLKEQFNIGASGITQVASQTRKLASENKEFAQNIQDAKEMVMVT